MKQLILWLALLLPAFAKAQNTNGTLQRQISSPNVIRGVFGSIADTIPSVRGVAVQGQLLQYNSTYKKWVPYTIPIDGATGIISGGTITGLGGASAIVAPGTGTVLDITNPVAPSLSEVAWATDTIALTDNSINYLYVTSGGVITATTTQATPADYRTRIYLGRVQKTSGVITSINGDYVPIQQTPANLNDMFKAYGMAKTGLAVTPASTDLTIAVSSGSIFSLGANFSNSVLAPNTLNYTANSPQTFRMVTSGGISVTDVTVLPVGSYNPAGTTVSAIGGGANESSIFTVYKFPTTGNVRVLYGQTLYPSLTAAVSAIGSYSPSPPASFADGIIIGYIAAVKTATNLANTAQAVFVTTNKFGLAGGAVASSALANYMQTDFSNRSTTLPQAGVTELQDSLNARLRLTGGIMSGDIVRKGSADLVYDFQNAAGTRQGYLGRITTSGSGMWFFNATSNESLRLLDATGLSYTGAGFGLSYLGTGMLKSTSGSIAQAVANTDYLAVNNPAFTGTLTGPSATIAGNIVANSTGSATITLNALAPDYATIQDDDNFDRIWFETTGGFRTILDLPNGGSINIRDYLGNIVNTISETGVITTVTQPPNDNSTKVATTAYVDAATGGGLTFSSGTYTPTITNGANVASSSLVSASYISVGNQVMVEAVVTITATSGANINTTFDLSLPIASNLVASSDLRGGSGGMALSTLVNSIGIASGDVANNRATISFVANTAAIAVTHSVHFQYTVL